MNISVRLFSKSTILWVLAALQMAKQRDVVLIDSSRVVDERGKTVVRGYIYDTENNKVYYIDKQYLAPQGEFMPYVVRAVLHFVPKSTWKQNILKQLSYETGEVNTLAETSTGLPNVLFCMESISPISVRQLLQKHPSTFIAHPVSHTWFSDSSILRQQLYHMLRVQSVWNGVPIVASGNMFDGYTVYPNGTRATGSLIEEEKYWTLRVF
jgi:apolipoprotein N-acyltransferase